MFRKMRVRRCLPCARWSHGTGQRMSSEANTSAIEAGAGSSATASTKTIERFVGQLIERRHLDAQVAERVLRVQRDTFDRLGSVLLKLGLLSEEALAAELSAFTALPRLKAADIPTVAVAAPDISPAFL